MTVAYQRFSRSLQITFAVLLGMATIGFSAKQSAADPVVETPQAVPQLATEQEHQQTTLEISAHQPLPSVRLVVHPDVMRGWNLEVQTENFQFAPEHISQNNIQTEGHAHLYIDGIKVTRLYGHWYYLGSLPPGRHELRVTLNTNEHETLVKNGEPIEDVAVIEVPTENP